MKYFSAFTVLCLSATFAFAQSSKTDDYHLDKEFKMSPTGTLSLSSADAKVTIVGSARTTAHVKIDKEVQTKGIVFSNREFEVEVTERDGNLSVQEKSSGSVAMMGYHYEKYTILIELPEGASITVRGDDGDYNIKHVNGSIDMSVDDGDISISNCAGNQFRFQMDDGDLIMEGGSGSLDIDGDDADVEIKNSNFENIVADIDDGDLIIETSLTNSGNYRIDSQDGLVSLAITQGGGQFNIRHDDGHVTSLGKFEIMEESEDFTRLKLAAGSAQVNIRADDARVKLAAR